jgi:hypothetical protein
MRIVKFNNFLLNEEIEAKGVYYIFEKPFRVDDLISFLSKTKYDLFTINDISRWCKKYKFDKDAVGLFVSKNKIKKDIEPFKRYDRDYEYSGIDIENIEDLEEPESDNEDHINLKELLEKIPDENLELRISSRRTKNKLWFDTKSRGMSGEIVEECKIKYGDEELYLFIFNSGKNNDERARQLHGFIYEADVKKKFIEEERKLVKGEKWDAIGSLNLNYLQDRIDEEFTLVSYKGKEVNNINFIKSEFSHNKIFYWSVKASKLGTSIYFGDFKRISGLDYNNGKLSFNKSDLDKYMLVVGRHYKGEFIKEYVIEIDIKKWFSYLPDINNKDVFNSLEEMYQNLHLHKAMNKEEQVKGEKAWKEYIKKYSKLTEGENKISLNFKRDSKGQLRIQASMTDKLFNKLLSENKHILLEKK